MDGIFRAVGLLAVETKEGEECFLSVSRRNVPGSFGLPGGKVDPGENEVQAVVRETLEETGLVVSPLDILPVYSGWCPPGADGRFFWTTTFVLRRGVDLSSARQTEPGIFVTFTPLSLLGTESDAFPVYNSNLLAAFSRFKNHGFTNSQAVF